MLLTIDIGNTQVALGMFDGDDLIGHWRVSTDATATFDELRWQLTGILGSDPGDHSRAEILHGKGQDVRGATPAHEAFVVVGDLLATDQQHCHLGGFRETLCSQDLFGKIEHGSLVDTVRLLVAEEHVHAGGSPLVGKFGYGIRVW